MASGTEVEVGDGTGEDLHAPHRRLDLAFAALTGPSTGTFLHCLQGSAGTTEPPTMLRERLPEARWIPTDLHALTFIDASDHLRVHQAWLEACYGPDRVARATVRIIRPLVAADGGDDGPAGLYDLTLIDLVGTDGVDAVVVVLRPVRVDNRDLARSSPAPRGAESFRLRVDVHGTILDAGPGMTELVGHRPDQVVGLALEPFLHPDDVLSATEAWRDLLARPDRSQSHRLRMRHLDGSWRWLSATSWNALADPVRAAVVTELHDIHALVEAEQARAASELGFRALAESLPVGVAVLDEDGRVHFANHRLVTILGDAGISGPGSPLTAAAPAGPGFTTRWIDLVDAAFAAEVGAIVRPGDPDAETPVSGQFRVAGVDGAARHLLVQAVTIRNAEGRNVIVSVQDVSDDVRTSQAHDRLLQVVDEVDDAVIVGELDGAISYLNQAARRYLGADVLGLALGDFMRPALREQIGREILPALRSARAWRGDLEIRDREGEFHTMATSVSPVLEPGRTEVHFGVTLRDVTAERAHARELAHQARHDPLSGLPNRVALMEHLEGLVAGAGIDDEISVCFIDLDNLKIVNDGLGHSAGDRLIEVVADQLRSVVGPDIVARFGGDEFVVVGEGMGPADALVTAHRLLVAVERAHVPGVTSHMSASIGVATARRVDLDPEGLVRDADAAMYAAKRAGRGRCAVFDEALRERVTRRFVLETNLRQTLADDALGLHLQPVVSLATGETTGLEALARWGSVSPAEFIPVAEDSGLIGLLGHAVLKRSLLDAARLRASRPALAELRIGVNVSGRELDEPQFAERFLAAIEESEVPAEHVVLELTESVLIDPGDHVDQAIERLRAAGVDLALDDFGSGYSSLSYLRRYPIDLLKLDVSYTQALTDDLETRVIVEAIVSMATRLGIGVVAEGVETVAQLDVVRELGVRWAQGYLLGRPAPVEDLLASGLPPSADVIAAG